MDNEAIRSRLREVRKDTGLSQTAFAQKLSMPFRSYQAIEGGERGISVEAVDSLYENFAINPLWLLRGTGIKQGDPNAHCVSVLRGLLDRWERYPVVLTAEEKVDDFARVLEHASKLGLSDQVLDIAVRRVG